MSLKNKNKKVLASSSVGNSGGAAQKIKNKIQNNIFESRNQHSLEIQKTERVDEQIESTQIESKKFSIEARNQGLIKNEIDHENKFMI